MAGVRGRDSVTLFPVLCFLGNVLVYSGWVLAGGGETIGGETGGMPLVERLDIDESAYERGSSTMTLPFPKEEIDVSVVEGVGMVRFLGT